MERVWLDFNALDADECWVSGGANATCPYSNVLEREEMNRRTLLVSFDMFFSLLVLIYCIPTKLLDPTIRSELRISASLDSTQ